MKKQSKKQVVPNVTVTPMEEQAKAISENTDASKEQKEFVKIDAENQKFHDEVADAVPEGVDAVNPPYPLSETIEAGKKGEDINSYRETIVKVNIEEVKSPAIVKEDFAKEFEKFQKKHGVYPTAIHASTVTLDKLHLREAATDSSLHIVEGGEQDGEVKLSFGAK